MSLSKPPQLLSDADFTIIGTIGVGSFSTVVKATNKKGAMFALKKLFWNNSPDRIVKEIQWLNKLDHPNIVQLYGAYRAHDQATLVMGYVPHTSFRSLLQNMTCKIIKDYMRGLLSALQYLHSHKIIHRDVKPANFLFDPETGNGSLIDFGLCEEDNHPPPPQSTFAQSDYDDNDYDFNFPQLCQGRPKMQANRAGTRGFRAPEVLISYQNQTSAIDMWSTGVVLLSMLSGRYPFFKSPDDLTSLCEVSTIIGTKRLHEAAKLCRRKIHFPREQEGIAFPDLVKGLNPYFDQLGCDESVFDLLGRLMDPSPYTRITAEDALRHEFLREK
ncbi:CMGC family protein kinase [Trichomonas vaginalis G3]|uniref:non-specific serine/threonine protein kinase n=1 Tax=Trichomonas vaginalis (strain ATCC PRA-98 / G3) TaxID=412133 RepID=A2DWN5_TRIV3|nr:cell division cycle [Trichomonas vaginalis G3]EAY15220.1 CMGC family protein kinase [Trichomonas vaginalis G3]KAI5550626.1 cell division cycle [Trichomonas vaginalis G3]|eukprot:XP_001327443.1 CMGC family protein kinase [Trichomonas vaginalis G3]